MSCVTRPRACSEHGCESTSERRPAHLRLSYGSILQLYGIGYTVSRVHAVTMGLVTPLPGVPIVSDTVQQIEEDCDQVLAKCSYTKPVWSGSAVGDLELPSD